MALMTFIPKTKKEGYARSGLRAGWWALQVVFIGVPCVVYMHFRDMWRNRNV